MIDFKIISDTDDEIEIEFTQQNDLIGDVSNWTDEDKEKWDAKMLLLEEKGTRGELETIRIKLKKNPFIDGKNYTG